MGRAALRVGTTGKPRGVQRDNGGHAVALRWSLPAIYDVGPGEVMFTTSDVGWVVGHSYVVYAPLLTGATTVLYEGKPIGTPDPGAFWRVIQDHRVKPLFTSPTAFRGIKQEDPTRSSCATTPSTAPPTTGPPERAAPSASSQTPCSPPRAAPPSTSNSAAAAGPPPSLLTAPCSTPSALGGDILSSCAQGSCGTCGTCEVGVLDGQPDHRDSVLDEPSRQRGNCMLPCVSRSVGDRLVLDL